MNDAEQLAQELRDRAQQAVSGQPRHGSESLFALLGSEYPEASDEQINQAIGEAL